MVKTPARPGYGLLRSLVVVAELSSVLEPFLIPGQRLAIPARQTVHGRGLVFGEGRHGRSSIVGVLFFVNGSSY